MLLGIPLVQWLKSQTADAEESDTRPVEGHWWGWPYLRTYREFLNEELEWSLYIV